VSLLARWWTPAGKPRAVVVLVHGLGDHTGRWTHVAGFLADRGLLVMAVDLPGHGRSPGPRGHASYELIEEVIGRVVAIARLRAGPDCSVFLYGHSMGGNRVIAWSLAHPEDRLAGVVASSPSIGGPLPHPSPVRKTLAWLLSRLTPTATMASGLDLANNSRDLTVVEAIRGDPLYHTRISARLAIGFLQSWAWFARWPGGPFPHPLLILQGTADRCVDPQATVALAARLSGDVTLKTWEGLYHELHNEPEKNEILSFIVAWMDKHLR
jgi:alpha-beta hydrolase superfamily lysophospholipase